MNTLENSFVLACTEKKCFLLETNVPRRTEYALVLVVRSGVCSMFCWQALRVSLWRDLVVELICMKAILEY